MAIEHLLFLCHNTLNNPQNISDEALSAAKAYHFVEDVFWSCNDELFRKKTS